MHPTQSKSHPARVLTALTAAEAALALAGVLTAATARAADTGPRAHA